MYKTSKDNIYNDDKPKTDYCIKKRLAFKNRLIHEKTFLCKTSRNLKISFYINTGCYVKIGCQKYWNNSTVHTAQYGIPKMPFQSPEIQCQQSIPDLWVQICFQNIQDPLSVFATIENWKGC